MKTQSRHVVKDRHDAFDEIAELHKRWDNRLRLDDRRFIERYRDGWLFPHVHLRVRGGGEWCVILQWNCSRPKSSPPKTHLGYVERTPPYVVICEANGQQQSVFVDDVEFVKLPNGMTFPTLVWFQRIDALHQVCTQALYASGLHGSFVVLGILPDRKRATTKFLSVRRRRHEPEDQMIQRASEVVQDVASKARDVGVERDLEMHARNVLSGLRICIGDDVIGVTVDECVNQLVEVSDVLIGPFNLDARIALPRIATHD